MKVFVPLRTFRPRQVGSRHQFQGDLRVSLDGAIAASRDLRVALDGTRLGGGGVELGELGELTS